MAIAQNAPNVVLILLDDVGFGDTSTFGGPAQTPSLDALAQRGLRYNRFHTTGICSPTRAALLSGRNHHRVGFGHFGGAESPSYDGIWKKSTVTVAELLRRNGYSTAAFGKWHNTPYHEITPVGPFDRWPTGLGFEYYYGNMLGMSSQWEPPLWRNTTSVSQAYLPDHGYHLTTDLVDDAIRWVQTHESLAPDKPFFLYFATGAAHTPHHVPQEWVDMYRGQFDQGWDALREQTIARQRKLGIVPSRTQLTKRPTGIPSWNSLTIEERKLFARQMEIFAGFVTHTDHEIGRLIETVQRQPSGNDTLIIYLVGDNGDDSAGGRDGTDNFLATLANSAPNPLCNVDKMGGPSSNTNHYANGWAWAGSTPFKWMKYAASHLGGTRNPMVVSWPARIKGNGHVQSQFTHVVDIVPTLLDVSGIPFPSAIDGINQVPLDGVSFAYTFNTERVQPNHRVQYFEIYGNKAVYKDDWIAGSLRTDPLRWPDALIPRKDSGPPKWELYNIAEDFSQSRDVATRFPKKLRELQLIYDQQARDNGVQLSDATMASTPESTQPSGGHSYTFFNGFPGVSITSRTAPDLSRPHHVTANIFIPPTGASGVILAAGGRDGGLSLYIKDQRLFFENNYYGCNRSIISTTETLPTGEVTLEYELMSSGTSVALYVNGQSAAEGYYFRAAAPQVLDYFDVGQDSAAPVSNDYQPPFKFTGAIKKVEILMK